MCFGQNNQTDNFPLDRDRLVDKAQPSPVAGQPVCYRVIIHVILINLYLAHIFWGEKLIDTPTSDIQNQFCKYYRRDRRDGRWETEFRKSASGGNTIIPHRRASILVSEYWQICIDSRHM